MPWIIEDSFDFVIEMLLGQAQKLQRIFLLSSYFHLVIKELFVSRWMENPTERAYYYTL